MTPGLLVVAGALGAVLGSFANVMIYRLPRDESIVWPGSRCPQCGAAIRAWDNIPLISFVVLRGRCRACGGTIAARYPLVEALTTVLAIATWAAFHDPQAPLSSPSLLRFLWALTFSFLLVVITFIDLDHQLILNRITYPGIVVGLAFALAQGRLVPSALAAVGGAGLITVIVVASRGGMGIGDIKLSALLGAFLGWPGIAVALFAGFMIGGVVGLVLLALRLRSRKDAIPFGPALAAGGLVALFWGDVIVRWYWP